MSWKIWKVLWFYFEIFQDWKVLQKRPQVLESPGNLLNSRKKVFRIDIIRNVCRSLGNWVWNLGNESVKGVSRSHGKFTLSTGKVLEICFWISVQTLIEIDKYNSSYFIFFMGSGKLFFLKISRRKLLGHEQKWRLLITASSSTWRQKKKLLYQELEVSLVVIFDGQV